LKRFYQKASLVKKNTRIGDRPIQDYSSMPKILYYTNDNCNFHHIKVRKRIGKTPSRGSANAAPSKLMTMSTARLAPRAQGKLDNVMGMRNTVGRSGDEQSIRKSS
jgi:hypothetical protein